MGLDWCVQPRENDDGTTTSPAETAGAMKLDRDNPESVKVFREVYDSHCKNALAQVGKPDDELEDLIDKLQTLSDLQVFPIDGGSAYQKHWLRRFEDVLKDTLAEGEREGRPVFLLDTIPEDCPARAKASGIAVSPMDFRGKIIGYMEGLPDDLKRQAYEEMEPTQAIAFAKKLMEHRVYVSDEDKPWLDAAVTWLLFWGERGHGIHAWY